MNMLLTVLAAAFAMMAVERVLPAWRRALDSRWILRAAAFNLLQAAVVLAGTVTWDKWFSDVPLIAPGTLSGAGA